MVYSPHLYGPSVAIAPQFSESGFPNNVIPFYDEYWAFLEAQTGSAVVMGEWGGKYVGQDRTWQDFFAQFLTDRRLNDNFYWDLNPNSGDTGGILLDDWSTPNSDKLALLARTEPRPTR